MSPSVYRIGLGESRTLVRQIPVGPMQNFVYLLAHEQTREAIAVDCGWRQHRSSIARASTA